jgi:hypothetical protein
MFLRILEPLLYYCGLRVCEPLAKSFSQSCKDLRIIINRSPKLNKVTDKKKNHKGRIDFVRPAEALEHHPYFLDIQRSGICLLLVMIFSDWTEGKI